MNYELKQYSFGETIGKAFNLYFNNFIALILISLLCQVPVAVMTQFAGLAEISQGVMPEIGPSYFIKTTLLSLTSLVATSLLAGWVVKLVADKFLESRSISADNQVTSILSLVLPIIGLSILIGIFTVLWCILLVIPGIIAALSYCVAIPALVIEKQTIRQAIKRSKSLTKGKKWTVFGLFLVVGIIIACVTQPLTLLLGFLKLPSLTTFYLKSVITAIATPIQSCLFVVIYFNLRIEKEGFNIEHLAQQFSLADTGQQREGPTLEA